MSNYSNWGLPPILSVRVFPTPFTLILAYCMGREVE